MKSWTRLHADAKRLDVEIQTIPDKVATLYDIASLGPLVVVTVGDGVAAVDRDHVLRGAVSGALNAIRRRGA